MKTIGIHKLIATTISGVLIIAILMLNFNTQCFSLPEISASFLVLFYNIIIMIYEEIPKSP